MNKLIAVGPEDGQEAAQGVDKTVFGFWIYLMTDCVLFASIFATYAILQSNPMASPAASEVFDLPFVLAGTLILLMSSFTCGLAMLAVHKLNKNAALAWFGVTFLFGLAFLGMELYEFTNLINEGYSWATSGFLSAFFTLVATHGLHIAAGLLWILVLMIQIYRRGLSRAMVKRATLLSLFWHFLDIIWIFIFTFVYLIGVS